MPNQKVELRKKPQQDRSVKRVNTICTATQKLIAKKGVEATTLSAVAKLAGVPIGSVYQYFPNKAAIVLELVSRFMEEMNQVYAKELDGIDSLDAYINATTSSIDTFYKAIQSDPVILNMLSMFSTDKALIGLDVEDSNRNAKIFTGHLLPYIPKEKHKEAQQLTLIFSHAITSVIQLALTKADNADSMITSYKKMVTREILYLSQSQ